jgi:hypothetical protein
MDVDSSFDQFLFYEFSMCCRAVGEHCDLFKIKFGSLQHGPYIFNLFCLTVHGFQLLFHGHHLLEICVHVACTYNFIINYDFCILLNCEFSAKVAPAKIMFGVKNFLFFILLTPHMLLAG